MEPETPQLFQTLQTKDLLNLYSRRDFSKTLVLSFFAGVGMWGGSQYGLRKAGNRLAEVITGAEREILRLSADLKSLSGIVEQRLALQTRELESQYSKGKLRMYEQLGIASPAELREFEEIIKASKEFEAHYHFAERAQIFKDRIDKRLLSIDEAMESSQPQALQGINDLIRGALGKDPGQKGSSYRAQIKARLDELCAVYDANEDNRIAQAKVLQRLNQYIALGKNLPEEELELYRFIKDQAIKDPHNSRVRGFIKNYPSFDSRNESLLKLRAYLSRAEGLYGQIRQNQSYIMNLQRLLKDGIALKEQIRSKSAEEFSSYKMQFDGKVAELTHEVDGVIIDLKKKGYDIETRDDYINSGVYSQLFRGLIDSTVSWLSGIAGFLTGIGTYRARAKSSRIRAAEAATSFAVEKHNDLVEAYNHLAGMHPADKHKSPETSPFASPSTDDPIHR